MAGRWSADDDDRLRRSYANGTPVATIATALGRSQDAVVARRRALGLRPRRSARPWSALEDRLIEEATAAAIPATVIATRLGRSVEQVRVRRRRIGLARPAARPWSPAEDDAIRRGRPLCELDRTPGALRLRARALGVRVGAARRRWTGDEDALVRDGYSNGLTCAEIADALPGRTAAAVAARARKLGLATFARRWSAADDDRLFRTFAVLSIEEIATTLGRTPEAIRRRMHTLGLEPGRGPRRARSGARWTPQEDRVLQLHAGLNPARLATLLGRSDRAVAGRLRQLGLRAGRERSPHHPVPANGGLTPGERALVRRELERRGARAWSLLEQRLDRPAAVLRSALR